MGAPAGNQNASKRRQARSEEARKKIQLTQILNRLQAAHNGEIELTEMQFKAGVFLVNKAMSDPPRTTEISGSEGGPIQHVHKVTREIVSAGTED